MTSYTNVNGGATIDTSNNSYLLVALTGLDPQQLFNWPTQFQDLNGVIAAKMDVTSTAGGQSIVMPDATQTSVGASIVFNNVSTHNVTIYNNDGSTILTTLNGPSVIEIYLIDNTTANGVWRNIPYGGGFAAVTSVAAASGTSDLVITGSPITTAGTLTFNLASDLLALTSFGAGTGIAVRTAANTWALRNVTGTLNQIAVTNPGGVAGNITLSLPPLISGINEIIVGNIDIIGNSIFATNLNGNISFNPNGTGVTTVSSNLDILNGNAIAFFNNADTQNISFAAGNRTTSISLIWPTVDPIATQVLQCASLVAGVGLLTWANVTTFGGASTTNAVAKFTNTTGTLGNSGVLIDNSNNVTGMSSLVAGVIQIGLVSPNTISTTAGNLILDANGANHIQTDNALEMLNGTPILMNNTGNTNTVTISVPNLVAPYNFVFPINAPLFNQLMINNSGNSSFSWVDPVCAKNILINGGFDIWQRNTSFTSATTFFPNNNNTYTADCWKLLSNGNNITNVSRGAGPFAAAIRTSASQYALRFTVQTASTKFGVTQYLETATTQSLIGKPLTLTFLSRGVGITQVKYAVITWNGAPDAPTANFISSWNALGVNPTLVANWAYAASGAFTVTTNYVGSVASEIGFSDTTITNAAVFFWVDNNAAAIGSTLDLACVKLEPGQTFSGWQPTDVEQELIRCKRWFQKDLPLSIAIGTAGTTPVGTAISWPNTPFVNNQILPIKFPIEMRTNPSTAVAYPVTVPANINRMSDSTNTDYGANSATLVAGVAGDGSGVSFQNTSGGGLAVTGNELNIHWYADCGF